MVFKQVGTQVWYVMDSKERHIGYAMQGAVSYNALCAQVTQLERAVLDKEDRSCFEGLTYEVLEFCNQKADEKIVFSLLLWKPNDL